MALPNPIKFTSQTGTRFSVPSLVVTGWHGETQAYAESFVVQARSTTFVVKARP